MSKISPTVAIIIWFEFLFHPALIVAQIMMGVLATCFVLQATGAAFPEPTLPEPVYKVARNEPESAVGMHTDLQNKNLTSTGPAACAACVAACHGALAGWLVSSLLSQL